MVVVVVGKKKEIVLLSKIGGNIEPFDRQITSAHGVAGCKEARSPAALQPFTLRIRIPFLILP